jgi:ABC-type uncharacterized transport system permease subunit
MTLVIGSVVASFALGFVIGWSRLFSLFLWLLARSRPDVALAGVAILLGVVVFGGTDNVAVRALRWACVVVCAAMLLGWLLRTHCDRFFATRAAHREFLSS